MLRTGRKWRSLEDTAVASHLLRPAARTGTSCGEARTYYFEGALLWLEADAIIRQKTDGKRSLDDFCRKFLGKNPSTGRCRPVRPGRDRPGPERHGRLRLGDVPRGTGRAARSTPCRWTSSAASAIASSTARSRRPRAQAAAGRHRGPAFAGLSFGGDGHIIDVVPGMLGDRAGLAPGMKVMGINGRLFSPQRLHDALADSVARRKIDLLLLEGDRFRTIVLDYADGPKYLELVRDESKPDLLAEILKPATTKDSPVREQPKLIREY